MRHTIQKKGECFLASAAMLSGRSLNDLRHEALQYFNRPWLGVTNSKRILFFYRIGIIRLREAIVLFLASSWLSPWYVTWRYRTPPENKCGFVLTTPNARGALKRLFMLNRPAKRSGHACAFEGQHIYDPALPIPVHRKEWLGTNNNLRKNKIVFIPIQRTKGLS